VIRRRRHEDVDRLVEASSGEVSRAWLEEVAAEMSWVFDQAPVSAAPTRRVIGHVQVHRSAAAHVGEALVVGRMIVTLGPHRVGVARFLLREALAYVDAAGTSPVVDATVVGLVPVSTLVRHRLDADLTDSGEVFARR
jgi:hypothetical protein